MQLHSQVTADDGSQHDNGSGTEIPSATGQRDCNCQGYDRIFHSIMNNTFCCVSCEKGCISDN